MELGIKRNTRLITSQQERLQQVRAFKTASPLVEGGGVFVQKSLQDLAGSNQNCVCATSCVHNLFRVGSGAGKEMLRRGERKVGEEREKDP